VLAFVALDTDGNRVLAKYYKPKHSPEQFSGIKPLSNTKEQRAFEKSLFEKTKKPGGKNPAHSQNLHLSNLSQVTLSSSMGC
jgi:hypothetical protein